MTDIEVELLEIKETLKRMQANIKALEERVDQVNPQCFWSLVSSAIPDCNVPIYSLDYPLSLSAAKSLWPYMEKQFDEYCAKHNITVWTSTDSENFYNEYLGTGADWPNETFNDVQNG